MIYNLVKAFCISFCLIYKSFFFCSIFFNTFRKETFWIVCRIFSSYLTQSFSPSQRINPIMNIWCKQIQVTTTQQPNRILIHKPTGIRFVIPEEIVMHPSFTVCVLVLQAERLVHVLVNPLVLFQTTSTKVLRSSENIEYYFLFFFLGFNSSLRCL